LDINLFYAFEISYFLPYEAINGFRGDFPSNVANNVKHYVLFYSPSITSLTVILIIIITNQKQIKVYKFFSPKKNDMN
jgi:hypothetical protein